MGIADEVGMKAGLCVTARRAARLWLDAREGDCM